MRQIRKIRMLLLTVMFFGGVFAWLGAGTARAAETQITPGSTMETAPQIELGNNYYSVLNNSTGYVKFTTPAQNGYITVTFKNISVDSWANAYVKTAIGEELYHFDERIGNSESAEWTIDIGNTMETNTTYYLQFSEKDSGNVLYSVGFVQDDNPDEKERAEKIELNTAYTRSIDSWKLQDWDFFRFTTGKVGAHRFSINKSDGSSWMNYEVRKWTTDELVKDNQGSDVKDDFHGTETSRDIILEANTEYYLKIYDTGYKSYTFSINNQSVTSISMASSKTLAAGESFQLSPVVKPDAAYNKSVSFSSDNEAIARVNSDGTVTASSSNCGTATITATADDGSGVTATCKVVVVPGKPYTPSMDKCGTSSHTISWSSVSGVDGYTIYVKSGKKYKALGSTSGTSYTRKKLKSAKRFYYKIRSYVSINGNKTYSPYSDTCYACTTPKASKITKTKKGKKTKGLWTTTYRVTVKWKKVKGASGYELSGRNTGNTWRSSIGTTSGTKMKVWSNRGKSDSKVVYYYVRPYITVKGVKYYGPYSRSKKYRYH